MEKPVIGITPEVSVATTHVGPTERLQLNLDYTAAVSAAGGLPLVLPLDLEPPHALAVIDALLLTGGGDIDPARYGAPTVHPETYGVSSTRDSFEIALIQHAIALDLPILAICRGLQVLNVALGGTLIQHIPDAIPQALNHRQHELGIPVDQPAHPIRVVPDTLLARILGTPSLMVNSYHHQAIDCPAPGLVITAYAPDGVIEAAELPSATFVVAVQWHPERLFRSHPTHHALFTALVQAAQRSRTHRHAALARTEQAGPGS